MTAARSTGAEHYHECIGHRFKINNLDQTSKRPVESENISWFDYVSSTPPQPIVSLALKLQPLPLDYIHGIRLIGLGLGSKGRRAGMDGCDSQGELFRTYLNNFIVYVKDVKVDSVRCTINMRQFDSSKKQCRRKKMIVRDWMFNKSFITSYYSG